MRFDLKATPKQTADDLIDGGLSVIFTSAPALTGVYGLDKETLDQVGSVARDVGANLDLPMSAPYFFYPSKDNTPRQFTSEQIQALYMAMRDYMTVLTYFSTGQIPSPPTQPVTIP